MWNPIDHIGVGISLALCIMAIIYLNRNRINTQKINMATTQMGSSFKGWLANGATIQYYTT